MKFSATFQRPISPEPSRGIAPSLLLWALVILLAVFLLGPIVVATRRAFGQEGGLSAYWFGRVLANPSLVAELLNALLLACTATGLSLLLAVPLAVLHARCRFRGQAFLSLAVLAPMILPPFVGALSLRKLLSPYGVVNTLLVKMGVIDFSPAMPDWLGGGFAAVAALQALHLFPILYLNASASLANIDPAYAQAARNLGAGPVRTFFRVTLPLMRPGLFAGGTIIFIWSFTDVGTPLIVGYDRVTAATVFKELARGEIGGRTYSLVFFLLSAAVTFYVLGKFLLGRAPWAESSKGATAVEPRRLTAAGTAGAWLLFGAVIAMAILPHAGVVLLAVSEQWINTILPGGWTLSHLRFVFEREETYRSIFNSVRYAATATAIDLVLGVAAAWLIVRSRVRGRGLLDALVMLPLAVPGLILAAGYVAMTARGTVFESIGPTENVLAILVIAYAVRRLPFVVRGAAAGLEQVPVALEEAARNLGASRPGTLLRVTLPLIAANVIAAGVLTFAFSVLEVSDSLILAQLQPDYPIAKQIYVLATSTGAMDAMNQAAALGVCGMVLLGGTMALAGALLGKKLGAIFRA